MTSNRSWHANGVRNVHQPCRSYLLSAWRRFLVTIVVIVAFVVGGWNAPIASAVGTAGDASSPTTSTSESSSDSKIAGSSSRVSVSAAGKSSDSNTGLEDTDNAGDTDDAKDTDASDTNNTNNGDTASGDTANSTDDVDINDNVNSTDNDSTDSGQQSPIVVAIAKSTAVVTASSGYHLSATITNRSEVTQPAGTLTVTYNPAHIFVSRADMQYWSQGDVDIPTRTVLGQAAVPQLAAGEKATVTVDVAADSPALKTIVVWGPKPMLITYELDEESTTSNSDSNGNTADNGNAQSERTSSDTAHIDSTNNSDSAVNSDPIYLHSFLTRSSDGLNNSATPAMSITMVMPLAGSWQADSSAIDALVSQSESSANSTSSSNTSKSRTSNSANDNTNNTTNNANNDAGTTSSDNDSREQTQQQSQPQSQQSQQSQQQPQSPSNSTDSNSATNTAPQSVLDGVASLNANGTRVQAQQQVIAKHPNLQVVADPTLIRTTQQPTRINAVMQPSGFDITAYATKNDPETFENAGVSTTNWNSEAALKGITTTNTTIAWQGTGDWTLQALTTAKQQGYGTVIAAHDFDANITATVHTGKYVVPTAAGEVTVLAEQQELGNLAKGKATAQHADAEHSAAGRVARFVAQSAFYQMEQPYMNRNLLVCFNATSSPDLIDTLMSAVEQSSWLKLTSIDQLVNTEAYRSGNDALSVVPQNNKLSTKQSQSLNMALTELTSSRKDINRFASAILTKDSANSKDVKRWMTNVRSAHTKLALHALSQNAGDTREALVDGAKLLGTGMFNGVSLTPTESITVVSETAKMPVTISNDHPYPVHVKVSAITDSMEIVTSRFTEADVPAHGETQVTFTIRVATSGKTTAHINLLDRNDQLFGSTQNTEITSILRISDMSGFIMIGFSLLLGVLGLWRQFHRKKDPDE